MARYEHVPPLRQKVGFFGGIAAFLCIVLIPIPSLAPAAQKTLAVTVLMAFWWIAEALPIPATSLIPLIAFPFLKIMPIKEAAVSYGDSNIFLFMGGFFLAMSMQKCNLHKRIALTIIKTVGLGPKKIILGFMVATAFLSMWISNTATTMMMYPIGIAIIMQLSSFKDTEGNAISSEIISSFQISLMLGIAYAASIGGIGTKIGTPPNIIFSAAVKSLFPAAPEISFLKWMLVGIPLVIIFIPVAYFVLTHFTHRIKTSKLPFNESVISDELKALGPMSKAEKLVSVIFIFTALAWIFRKNIDVGFFVVPGWSDLLGVNSFVNDATIAIFASVLLFSIPTNIGKGEYLLDWKWAQKIPWGILLLFGGGIALAKGFQSTGLAEWIGNNISIVSQVPLIIMILIICLMLTFLTEVTSNTATSTLFMPILAATALAIFVHPFLLMIPATISASCAFMLPVATPPNAIIFGSGYVTIPQMVKSGIWLNIIGVCIITLITYLIAIPVFGIVFGEMPGWIH